MFLFRRWWATRRAMDETDYASKLDELDRLLNDLDVPMQPARVWSLLAEVSLHDLGDRQGERHGEP
jgi:hypothetical protein